MLEFLFLISLLALSHFLYVIQQENPFDRVLFRREYNVHVYNNTATIRFTKYASSGSIRKAIYDVMYNHQYTCCLRVENLHDWNIYEDYFAPFYFDRIDFSANSNIHFNCTVPLQCSHFVFPEDANEIPLCLSNENLEAISIPSQIFVPAKKYITYFDEKPLRVKSGFTVFVPNHLLDTYRNDPTWNQIQLIDEQNVLFSPAFAPYRPLY